MTVALMGILGLVGNFRLLIPPVWVITSVVLISSGGILPVKIGFSGNPLFRAVLFGFGMTAISIPFRIGCRILEFSLEDGRSMMVFSLLSGMVFLGFQVYFRKSE